MLDVLLEGFRDIQKRGFMWDLRYRGKTWKDLEFIPFVIFIKCDTKEANMLCGQFSTYNANFLCRNCQCPRADSDNPAARYAYKGIDMIKPLEGNVQALKLISQHDIKNAFYKIRFSPMSTRGIHGACPSEMLHAILLGNFMYLRDTLYEQVGETSAMAGEIDALSQLYGSAYTHQSERSMPTCNFTNGIREGHLNAKEYRGVLLAMDTILLSTNGKDLLVGHRDWNDKKVNAWFFWVIRAAILVFL